MPTCGNSQQAEQQDFTLLNSSLHLLCSRGEDFEPVRDYAGRSRARGR